MEKTVDDYVAELDDWRRDAVARLCEAVRTASPALREELKWAQPVYEANGPICYVRAHPTHVTFGLWRGAEIKPLSRRLECTGSSMAQMKIADPSEIDDLEIQKLVLAAVALDSIMSEQTKHGPA